jgi:hypothetical protein
MPRPERKIHQCEGGSSPTSGQGAALRGQVVSGSTPLVSFTVLLYATDPSQPH